MGGDELCHSGWFGEGEPAACLAQRSDAAAEEASFLHLEIAVAERSIEEARKIGREAAAAEERIIAQLDGKVWEDMVEGEGVLSTYRELSKAAAETDDNIRTLLEENAALARAHEAERRTTAQADADARAATQALVREWATQDAASSIRLRELGAEVSKLAAQLRRLEAARGGAAPRSKPATPPAKARAVSDASTASTASMPPAATPSPPPASTADEKVARLEACYSAERGRAEELVKTLRVCEQKLHAAEPKLAAAQRAAIVESRRSKDVCALCETAVLLLAFCITYTMAVS